MSECLAKFRFASVVKMVLLKNYWLYCGHGLALIWENSQESGISRIMFFSQKNLMLQIRKYFTCVTFHRFSRRRLVGGRWPSADSKFCNVENSWRSMFITFLTLHMTCFHLLFMNRQNLLWYFLEVVFLEYCWLDCALTGVVPQPLKKIWWKSRYVLSLLPSQFILTPSLKFKISLACFCRLPRKLPMLYKKIDVV